MHGLKPVRLMLILTWFRGLNEIPIPHLRGMAAMPRFRQRFSLKQPSQKETSEQTELIRAGPLYRACDFCLREEGLNNMPVLYFRRLSMSAQQRYPPTDFGRTIYRPTYT